MPPTTTTAPLEAGLFSVVSDRRVRGLLLPYGELSRTSQTSDPVTVHRGTITVPADPIVVGLNRDHDRFYPIGRADVLEDTDAGVVAEFEVARTPEGDEFLADPTRRRLSPEIRNLVRSATDRSLAVAGTLVGAAAVTMGAFESAALFAIGDVTEADPDDLEPATAPTTDPSPPATGPAGGEADPEAAPADLEADPEAAPAGLEDTTTTDAGDPAEQEGTVVPMVPDQIADEAQLVKAEALGASAVFAAVHAARNGDAEAEQMLAALADIKHSGTGALPAAGVLQPAWVGEVWNGRAYQRRYISLGTAGTIQGIEAKGYRLEQGTALVQPWAGNKAELPSGTATTALVTSTLRKYGFAADIAREFFDLPGGEELIAAFMRGVINSYARITDADALADIVAAAGAPVAPATYPTGYPATMGMLLQGIEAVEDADDSPTFAIVNTLAWRELLYTPRDQVPEFVTFGINSDGTGTADGTVQVVRGDIGIQDTAAVVVGSQSAITFNEPAGASPIQVDALNVAQGGLDRAVVGYMQTLVEYPDAIVLVGTADPVV